MKKQTKSYCIDIGVGKLLNNVKSDALLDPEHKTEFQSLFDDHLDNCSACREQILNHANELAVNQVATERNESVEEVLDHLRQVAKQLEEITHRKNITMAKALTEIIRKSQQSSFPTVHKGDS
jgi:predicted anti-sigma-YlaC factor YlaD